MYGGSYMVNLFKQKVVSQKNDLLATMTLHKNLDCHRLSGHIHCINCCVDVDGTYSTTVCPWSLLPRYTHGRSQGGPNGHFPLEIGNSNQQFLENLKLAADFRLIYLINLQLQFICRYDTDTAQEPGSLFWCHAMMRLQFTHVRSFVSRKSYCKTWEHIVLFGFHCVRITRQKFLKRSLRVTVPDVFPHMNSRAPTAFSFTKICFFSRPTFPAFIINNRVKSGFFELMNSSATSMVSIV